MKLDTHAWPQSYGDQAKPRMGFFTDTSVCIGCKACEVACKEWNQIPMSIQGFTGNSYDNTIDLGADTWRHVAFVEQKVPADAREGGSLVQVAERAAAIEAGVQTYQEGDGMRWLMASDVCKHCTNAACLEVCPTGALFRTEFGTVVVQQDVCNGCGYCIPACPFGVLDRREDDGRAWKCTLCYDRLKDDQEPACAQACPTNSIQFGELSELRERAEHRLAQLQDAGQDKAQLYLADDDDGIGGAGAFFLLLDDPEVYGLPPDPVDSVRDIGPIWSATAVAAAALAVGLAAAVLGGKAVSYSADSGPWPEARSYHGQPVLKDPVWTWEIPVYFYTGGVAGSSAGLAYLSELRGEELLARRAWTVALAGIAVSPAFLTADLGRPERFLNMLRMFKVTSPMSVGSWILSGSGAAIGLAAVNAWTGRFPRAAMIAKPAAAVLGLPLSTYTAALLANTAIPVWHHAYRLLPLVFGSGAALSAGAAIVAVTPPERARAARRLALGAAVVEGPLMELMALRLGKHGHAYRRGAAVAAAHLSRGCLVTGGTLLYARGGSSRIAAAAAGALLSVGALATRWSVFRAGFRSASDPRYVVGSQRELIERGQRRGAARKEPRVSPGDPRRGSPATSF